MQNSKLLSSRLKNNKRTSTNASQKYLLKNLGFKVPKSHEGAILIALAWGLIRIFRYFNKEIGCENYELTKQLKITMLSER